MPLTDHEMQKIREAIESAVRPIILFDDDPDGLSSFLMIYKKIKEGKGIPIKNAPEVTLEFARTVKDYSPDLIIILDMPMVSQDFLDEVNTRTIWLDHHPVQKMKNVEYYNPRVHDDKDNRPTSYWVYRILNENIWLAMCGMVGDWFMPEEEIRQKFIRTYPNLLDENMKKPEEALHNSKLGDLIRAMAFNLKGRTQDVIKSVKVFTRITSPDEILEQKSPGGRFIYKKFQKLDEEYKTILKQINVTPTDKMILFTYKSSANSFSTEISNELTYKYPGTLIIVAWEYNGEYKCSLRSTKHNLPKIIETALDGVSGYGGGHEHASGACIKREHFDQFVENIKKQI